ncbi:MAG: NADH-quinone oxidoreductase subunit NuoN [Arenicellales bacterium]|nr:NADH-quinone oxidoreductase subunit NuoN [Arenicellales bacterium]
MTELNIQPILPEIFIAVMACVILVVDLYIKQSGRGISYVLTLVALFGGAYLCWHDISAEPVIALNGMFVDDVFSDVLKIIICLLALLVFVYSREYIKARDFFSGEYFVLGLFGVVGMMVMTSANHFLALYLGLELLSLCLYTMVAFQRDSVVATEAAMKYFVLGALASAMLLYGMSIVYGLTGTLDIETVRESIREQATADNITLILGLVFILVSLAFKIGAVPFHMWIPDVYHGAPTSSTLFVSTAPKLAGFAIIMRLLVGGLEDLHFMWRDMVVVLAVLSIALGNLIAIAQTNLKRMLAYSAISHMGFMLLGVLAGTANGYSAGFFYSIVYAFMGLGGFGMVILLSRADYEADELDDLKGLNQRNPWYAFLLLLLMFSMAGVPPTIGFFAKLAVIQAVIEVGLTWLAVVAVLMAVVGAFYYLRVVKLMYFDPPAGEVRAIEAPADFRFLMSVNAVAMVLLLPVIGPIQDLCNEAISSVVTAF